MKITARLLRSKGACKEQVTLFEETFGSEGVDTAKLTKRRVLALAPKFHINWAANHLLDAAQRAKYKCIQGPALAEYKRIRDPAYAEYKRIKDAAFAKYERIQGPAWDEYKCIEGAAWAEYERIQGPAWAEYKRTIALAFWEASKL